ncbi:MAG: ATP-binding cassette domain-containing protein [Verrucomicrobiota bacterium]
MTGLSEYRRSIASGSAGNFGNACLRGTHRVREHLVVAARKEIGVEHLLARLSSEERDRIDGVLNTVGLSERANWKAGAPSHGQKQWLETGMLLAQDPKLLLVDEPAAGMTDEETRKPGNCC